MRSLGVRLPILVAILWAGIGSSVWALGHHGSSVETAYVLPSTTTLAVPTSYVVASTWVTTVISQRFRGGRGGRRSPVPAGAPPPDQA